MKEKLEAAIKLLTEIEPHIDEWNFPIGMKEEIIEFLASTKEGAEK